MVEKSAMGKTDEFKVFEDGNTQSYSELCSKKVRNIRERSVKIREGLPPDNPLRSSATAISKRAKAIEQE